jgi:hypothetical protein
MNIPEENNEEVKQTGPNDKEEVTLTREELRAVIEEVTKSDREKLQGEIRALQDDKNMLLEVADEKRLSKFYEKNRAKIGHHVTVGVIEDRIILGWEMAEDTVRKNLNTGHYTEKQIIRLKSAADPESGKVTETNLDYPDFISAISSGTIERLKAKITDKVYKDDELGKGVKGVKITYKVKVDQPGHKLDGKEFQIAAEYVNF